MTKLGTGDPLGGASTAGAGIHAVLTPFCRPQPYDVVGMMVNYQSR